MIRLLFFGPVADLVKTREMQFDFVDKMTLHDVIEQLSVQYPKAFGIVSFVAVNQNQVRDEKMALQDNDEIAFMAKYSGG